MPESKQATRQNLGLRLPADLLAALAARADVTGQSRTDITEAALRAYLGMGDANPLDRRLGEIEQRLGDVEKRVMQVTPQRRFSITRASG